MSQPTVSIVIPTFNRSAMLRRCVESALAQTRPCEVIVVDHGSSDDTPAVAASFGNRIRYLRRDVDQGVHFCWLDGVLAARNEFVHLNFDDDFMRPEYIEKCMDLLGPDVALAMSSAEVRDEASGRTMSQLFTDLGPTGVYPVRRFMRHHIASLVSPGAIILRKKDILDQLHVGGVPFARHEYRGVGPDWLMSAMATLHRGKFAFVAEPLVVFSAHKGSITVDAARDAARQRALSLAYQQARNYYMMARLIRTFRLDLHARAILWCAQSVARKLTRLRRSSLPKPPAPKV